MTSAFENAMSDREAENHTQKYPVWPYWFQLLTHELARVALSGAPSCWKCGAELPTIGIKCAVCGVDQIPF